MATSKRQCNGKPHFFKVVLSPAQDLRIPTAFMEKHGDSLMKNVVLKVPTGDSWPVQLCENRDGTWLGEGWQEFVTYYAIEIFYFLVFRYDGNSEFRVIIFDPSASEIEYPAKGPTVYWKTTKVVRELVEVESEDYEDGDVSVEILEPMEEEVSDVSVETEPELNQVFQSETSGVKTRSRVKIEQEHGNFEEFEEDVRSWKKSGKTPIYSSQTVINKEEYSSYQRARAFEPKNPSFIRFMQPSYVTDSYLLKIPLSLGGKKLPKQRRCGVVFHVPLLRKAWRLKYHKAAPGANFGTVDSGWKEFVLDNKLVVGDVCVFECVEDDPPMFFITIFRNQ